MKYFILFASILLSGCWLHPEPQITYVDIPVWTAPKIDMPIRPVLRSDKNDTGTLDFVTKNIEIDMNNLMTYSYQLENIINTIKNYTPSSSVQSTK